MLHSFCRQGDARFMQLSSLLPILSSSFLNTRLVPRAHMGRWNDFDRPLSAVRDEMPFMDTDVARGIQLLTLENFLFFCNEFGISGYGVGGEFVGPPLTEHGSAAALDFPADTHFVALQFLELGGDHLDRLMVFSEAGRDLAAVRAAEEGSRAMSTIDTLARGEDDVQNSVALGDHDDLFWADIHEVLLGSLRLLAGAARTVYFINCSTLFPRGVLQENSLRVMLRKLRFLDRALSADVCDDGSGGGEVLFYCARTSEVDCASFDAVSAWEAAVMEVSRFCSRDGLASTAAVSTPTLADLLFDESCDTIGLDMSPLDEVAREDARQSRDAEQRARVLLGFVRQLLVDLVFPMLKLRLRLCGVHAVRSLADDAVPAAGGGSTGTMCVPSVVANVARLLQRRVCISASPGDNSLTPQLAELLLRCAAQARRIEPPKSSGAAATVLGRWVTRACLSTYLEDCEADHRAIALPEVSAMHGWGDVVAALTRSAVCVPAADYLHASLPEITVEIAVEGVDGSASVPIVRIRPAPSPNTKTSGTGVVFVTRRRGCDVDRSSATNACAAKHAIEVAEAIGLPFDAELFRLLTSESGISSIRAHVARMSKISPGSRHNTESVAARDHFRFLSPEAIFQLCKARSRLRASFHASIEEIAIWAAAGDGVSAPSGMLDNLFHLASDLWQADAFCCEGVDAACVTEDTVQPAAKRVCGAAAADSGAALTWLAERLQAAVIAQAADISASGGGAFNPHVSVELANVERRLDGEASWWEMHADASRVRATSSGDGRGSPAVVEATGPFVVERPSATLRVRLGAATAVALATASRAKNDLASRFSVASVTN
eukprot:TRINITY_DN55199_c0_g1_i1.p1 TRINITY_DN55199_c0_g1~~TRINITY_DN55199_c0_g1_i1.p1  ORF type:complete len:921 (-),score=129.80 TRINITY_DN55199_c0_g1_i1:118-2622(-)